MVRELFRFHMLKHLAYVITFHPNDLNNWLGRLRLRTVRTSRLNAGPHAHQRRLSVLLAGLLSVFLVCPVAMAKPIYKMVPSTPFFVGRQLFMETLEHDLNTHVVPSTQLITITGVSGAGKTHIAAKFAEIQRIKKNYDLIWWFDCELSLGQQFLKLAKKLNHEMGAQIETEVHQQAIKELLSYLKKTDANWLLIFDNADSYAQIKPFLPKNSTLSKAHILVTSQNNLTWGKTYAPPGLSRSEVSAAIDMISGRQIPPNSPIVDYLLNSTFLEIEQAATLLRYYRGEESALLAKLKNGELSVQTPLAFAVNHIMRQESASQLLSFISFLHGKKIPLDLLKAWYRDHTHTPKQDFDALITKLKSKSLISSVEHYAYIHSTTQAIVRRKLTPEQSTLILNQIIDLLLSLAEQEKNIVLPDFYIYIEHAKEACSHAFKLPTIPKSVYRLALNIIDEILVRQKESATGYDYIHSLQSYFTDNTCPYKDLIGAFLNKKAYALNALGDLKGNYNILLKAKPYLSEQTGLNEYLKNTLYLARRAQELGDMGNAEKTLIEAEKLMEKYHFSDVRESLDAHFNQMLYYHVKAHYFIDKGEYQNALKYANRAILLFKGLAEKFKAHEQYGKVALPSYIPQQLALLKLVEQRPQHESIDFLIAKLNKQLGNKPHKFSAFLHTLYAQRLLGFGNYLDAEKELQLAFSMYEQINHNKHPSRYVAYAYKTLGDYFAQQSKWKQAIFNYEYAFRCYESSLLHLGIAEVEDLLLKLVKTLVQAKDFLSASYYYQNYVTLFNKTDPELSSFFVKDNNLEAPL